MREKLLAEIIELLDPGEINKNIEVVTVNEKRESITILFEEQANLIPQGLKEKEPTPTHTHTPHSTGSFSLSP